MSDTKAIKPEDNIGGTFTQLLSVAEVTTAYVSPVPTEAPGFIVAEPGVAKEEAIYFKSKDAGAGTISGLTRDFTNLNGGVGQEHANGEDWEVLQSALYIQNIIDILLAGFIMEQATVAKVDASNFTVVGNVASIYSVGRMVRLNGSSSYVAVITAVSYSNPLTTITVTGITVPTLTSAEYSLQPSGVAFLRTADLIDEDDMASDSASKVPSQQSVKAYVDSPSQALSDGATITLDLGLGAYRKHDVTLGGNRILALSNVLLDMIFMAIFYQDTTGSRTVTHPLGLEDFATTDVDTGTEIITVGLDIPTGTKVRLTTTTTLPAGLSLATDYFVIRVSATTIKLATSLVNAQAGTAVNITDQGTGTHTLNIYVRWADGEEPTLSTDEGLSDYIGYVVLSLNSSDNAAFVLSGHVIDQGVV